MQQVQANDKPNDAVNTTFSYQASLGDSAAPQMMTLLVSGSLDLQKLSMQGLDPWLASPAQCFQKQQAERRNLSFSCKLTFGDGGLANAQSSCITLLALIYSSRISFAKNTEVKFILRFVVVKRLTDNTRACVISRVAHIKSIEISDYPISDRID